ncbi:MAG: hypothetical protein OQK46_05770 [Gammaproteobacteria bacterium]|nr:hypothetical protein [Gammaproteobacteria bacterium]
MSILELVFTLSANEFSVPQHKQIVDTVEKIQMCKENPDAHADCKNILERYLEMKDRTGGPYVNIQ